MVLLNLKKILPFLVAVTFSLLSLSISSSYAQDQLLKLNMPAGLNQYPDDDCNLAILRIFSDNSNKLTTELSGYTLTEVVCNASNASLTYMKQENLLTITLFDHKTKAEELNRIGGNELTNILLNTQKANILLMQEGIEAFNELMVKFPTVAETLKKTTPPAVELSLVTGDPLYLLRQPCEEKECGSIGAMALLKNDRYFLDIHLENHLAAKSDDAANHSVQQILQIMSLDNLQ